MCNNLSDMSKSEAGDESRKLSMFLKEAGWKNDVFEA